MGAATDRPYGQDGGVVQLPLAIDKILAGESPYGADYSGTILARQARVSSFWDELGGNPILRHHAYLPGTHLVMLPFYLAGRGPLRRLRPARRDPPLLRAGRRSSPPVFPASVEGRLCAAGDRGAQPARLLAPDLRRERPRVRGDAPGRGARSPASRGRSRAGAPPRPRLRHQAARLALRAVPPRGALRGPLVPRPRGRRGRGGACSGPSAAAAAVFVAVVAPGRGPGLPRVLGRHRGLQRRPARRRQLPVRRHARLRLRELPHLLRPGGRPAGLLPVLGLLRCCSCRSASCSCARSFGTGTRSGRSPRAAPRSSPRSTSRASSTRTT